MYTNYVRDELRENFNEISESFNKSFGHNFSFYVVEFCEVLK